MQFDYAKAAATADRLLKRYGAAAVLTRTTSGAYDPATGTAPTTTSTQNVTAMVFDFDTQMAGQTFDGQSLILTGDKQAYFSAVGVGAIKVGDAMPWDGGNYTLLAVKRLAPAGIAVLYEAQIRGA